MLEGLFQPMHLLVVAGIALLIFGPKKLPELGKELGDGIRGFKSAMDQAHATPQTTTEMNGIVIATDCEPKIQANTSMLPD